MVLISWIPGLIVGRTLTFPTGTLIGVTPGSPGPISPCLSRMVLYNWRAFNALRRLCWHDPYTLIPARHPGVCVFLHTGEQGLSDWESRIDRVLMLVYCILLLYQQLNKCSLMDQNLLTMPKWSWGLGAQLVGQIRRGKIESWAESEWDRQGKLSNWTVWEKIEKGGSDN